MTLEQVAKLVAVHTGLHLALPVLSVPFLSLLSPSCPTFALLVPSVLSCPLCVLPVAVGALPLEHSRWLRPSPAACPVPSWSVPAALSLCALHGTGSQSGAPVSQKLVTDECFFLERLEANNYNTYRSRKYSGWYVALKRTGQYKLGPRTGPGQKAILFLPMSAKS